MPSGKTACPHITDNKDGTITIKYQPTERGLHEMDIKYEGNHIPGQKHITLKGCEVVFFFENNLDLFKDFFLVLLTQYDRHTQF